MPLSMYQATVPVYVRLLAALSSTLDKAAAHAAAKKVDPAVFITARLYPDMWSLAEQVRAATGHMVRGTSRLAGVPIPTFDGKEATFDDLKARIVKTIAFIQTVKPAQIDGSEDKETTITVAGNPMTLKRAQYLEHFAMVNFYFHCTTTYAILRQSGVEIGKRDFIGGL